MPELTYEAVWQLAREFFPERTKRLPDLVNPYSTEELVRAFQKSRSDWMDILKSLNDQQVLYSPDAQTYSISEIISHLVSNQINTYNGLLDLSSRVQTHNHADVRPQPGGGAEKGLAMAKLREDLQTATDDLADMFRQASRVENPQVIHYTFWGDMNYKSWMLFQLFHDLDHLRQVRSLMALETFPKTPILDKQ